jgi:hypothetical protein
MPDLKFKIKGVDGKLAYNSWRLVEAANIAAKLAWEHQGSTILVQTYQGTVQVFVNNGVLGVVPADLFSPPQWMDEFEVMARRPPPNGVIGAP